MKRAPTRDILWLFFGTRLILIMVTYIAFVLITAPKYSSIPVDTMGLFTSWNHWDAANYVRIAQFAYRPPYDFELFPLLHLLISLISHFLRSSSNLLVGTIFTNAAFLGEHFLRYHHA